MKGEARTAAPAQVRGLAFAAAAAAREFEAGVAGAEMEVGRGWKRGVRTARAMAMRGAADGLAAACGALFVREQLTRTTDQLYFFSVRVWSWTGEGVGGERRAGREAGLAVAGQKQGGDAGVRTPLGGLGLAGLGEC